VRHFSVGGLLSYVSILQPLRGQAASANVAAGCCPPVENSFDTIGFRQPELARNSGTRYSTEVRRGQYDYPGSGLCLEVSRMTAISDHSTRQPIAVLALVGLLFAACTGCQSGPQVADSLVVNDRPAWQQFASFRPKNSQLRQQWDEWGSQQLEDGDVIFVLGSSRILLGLLNFAKFSTEIAASPFSHVGIISIEDGKPYVYDTVSGGPRRKELGWFLARSSIQRVAFRRPRPEHIQHIPQVIQFCQQVYEDRVPYDERLVWGNDKYYCSEFVDLAFREQGIPLCDLTPINELPHFDALPSAVAMLIESTTPLSPEQEVLFPGNDTYGIWSSSELTVLLPPQPSTHVPRTTVRPVAMVAGDAMIDPANAD